MFKFMNLSTSKHKPMNLFFDAMFFQSMEEYLCSSLQCLVLLMVFFMFGMFFISLFHMEIIFEYFNDLRNIFLNN